MEKHLELFVAEQPEEKLFAGLTFFISLSRSLLSIVAIEILLSHSCLSGPTVKFCEIAGGSFNAKPRGSHFKLNLSSEDTDRTNCVDLLILVQGIQVRSGTVRGHSEDTDRTNCVDLLILVQGIQVRSGTVRGHSEDTDCTRNTFCSFS